jgi:hypothetical protein
MEQEERKENGQGGPEIIEEADLQHLVTVGGHAHGHKKGQHVENEENSTAEQEFSGKALEGQKGPFRPAEKKSEGKTPSDQMDGRRPGQGSHLFADAPDQGDGGTPDENRTQPGKSVPLYREIPHPPIPLIPNIPGFSQKEKEGPHAGAALLTSPPDFSLNPHHEAAANLAGKECGLMLYSTSTFRVRSPDLMGESG